MIRKKLSWLSLTFLISCARFPYTGLIHESSRYIEQNYKESFQSLDELRYLSMGNETGPLVVFIHGSPGSWESWAHFFKNESLLMKYQLIAFDRYGYGDHDHSFCVFVI